MAIHKIDPEIFAHLEWIGFVRPTGLVVSAPGLVRAGAILDRRDAEGQRLLRLCAAERVFDPKVGATPYLPDFRLFADSVLGWSFSPKGYAGTPESPIPPELEVPLTDYGETLRPDFAVRELEPKDGASSWQLLVRVLEPGEDFDRVVRGHGQFEASAQGRMERLLRQTGVSAGLLFNGRALRLVSAPRGESSGWLDFRVEQMVQTAGRPISTAMRLLFGQARLLSLPRSQRLSALLEDSRKFQNEVSEKLAEQVLHALYELLRGFQAAHDRSRGELLRKPLAEHPDAVYRALLTVTLRLVFLLFAEERDMLPEDEVFLRFYSLAGLYERLREDTALYPDAMDDRFSAWAQLLVLFRMIYDGAESGSMRLPKRHGVLFDPDRFPFLEGRASGASRQPDECIEPPLVPDGTIYRALEKLLVLDGERISYRALDVEQIGSVYETMMGFRLETATGRSVAVKADKKQGAPTAVNLEALLAEVADKREKFLQDHADRKLSDTIKKNVVAATTLEDLHAALLPVIDLAASPDLVSKGAMVLQPSEERRRSGSHYTPRSLTEPIVRTTLEPILARLRGEDGRPPLPGQILDLKVCDPAMGSGAFLVETCRQLGDALVESWHVHGEAQAIPPDEDEVIFARRMIAQRCLYGVDKNPVAVDLAKMSLWLVTLAKDHALTFVDHALRFGDSLVGLSRKQIAAFNWNPAAQMSLIEEVVRGTIDTVSSYRKQILSARDDVPYSILKQKLELAEEALNLPRQIGDAIVAAFFAAEKAKDRENTRLVLSDQLMNDLKSYGFIQIDGKIDEAIANLNAGSMAIHPFHWEIEYPEVFEQNTPGFDAIVGNPPFLGGAKIWPVLGGAYCDYIRTIHANSGGKAVDLVAHFFRRAFNLLRTDGTLGLIATNTISEGDTREAGLMFICTNGGTIFAALRRHKWPGAVSVVVSVVWIKRGLVSGGATLDGREVEGINSNLFPKRYEFAPIALKSNGGKSFQGTVVYGMGFTFDDTDSSGVSSSLETMNGLVIENPKNMERIFPFIGGSEVNESPTHLHHRYIINFANLTLAEASQWPDLLGIVEKKVKPERDKLGGYSVAERRKDFWWQYGTYTPALYDSISKLDRVLVSSKQAYVHFAVTFVPSNSIFAHSLVVFAVQTFAGFCAIQSRVHEIWARLFSGTALSLSRYNPSDCFHTFPFPNDWEQHPALELAGKACFDFRAKVMLTNGEGLTDTYHRVNDPDERSPDILQLRELHTAMDRSVLDCYGWTDIPISYGFFLDYEIDEEEWGDKKKPWRYRWPDEVRDAVLVRLLELNTQRAKEEELSGAAASKKAAKKSPPKRAPKKSGMEDLFS
jgi:hypothetical protein